MGHEFNFSVLSSQLSDVPLNILETSEVHPDGPLNIPASRSQRQGTAKMVIRADSLMVHLHYQMSHFSPHPDT